MSQAAANETTPECCSLNDRANSVCEPKSIDKSRKSIITLLQCTTQHCLHESLSLSIDIAYLSCLFQACIIWSGNFVNTGWIEEYLLSFFSLLVSIISWLTYVLNSSLWTATKGREMERRKDCQDQNQTYKLKKWEEIDFSLWFDFIVQQ